MKKHWTTFLPEGRRIFRDRVDALSNLEIKIKRAEEDLRQLYEERLIANSSLRRDVAEQYTAEEIELAYQEYQNQL